MNSRINRIETGLLRAKKYYPYFCASPVGLLKSSVHRNIAISVMIMKKVVKDSARGIASDETISDVLSSSANLKITTPIKNIQIDTTINKEVLNCHHIQSDKKIISPRQSS